MKELKLFSPLRSGSNYLGLLVERNFKEVTVHHNIGGWKHGPPIDTGADGYLLIMKNPFAWIDSMRNYVMLPEKDVEWYIDNWNHHAREIFSFQWREDTLFIKYEDLIRNLYKEMTVIKRHFELQKSYEIYSDEQRQMLRGGDNMKGEKAVSPTELRRLDHYLERKYFKTFSKEELTRIYQRLDLYLVKQLGYDYECFPAPF